MLVGDILTYAAERCPRNIAVIDKDDRIDFYELDRLSNKFAHALAASGISQGAVVGVFMQNCTEYATAYFGIAKAGAVSAHISTRSAPTELSQMLNMVNAEILVASDRTIDAVRRASANLPRLRRIVVADRSGSPVRQDREINFDSFMAELDGALPPVPLQDDAPHAITFTGGTTGRPKAVISSQKARYLAAVIAGIEFSTTELDVVGLVTPLYHSVGLFVWFLHAILLGATVVMLSEWNVPEFISTTDQMQISTAFLVPTQIYDLVRFSALDVDRLKSLTKINYAGAPMSPALLNELRSVLPWVKVIEHYGQSESGPIAVRPHFYPVGKMPAVGRPTIGTLITIRDAQGNRVQPGEAGEIVIEGEHIFSRYHDDREATAQAFRYGASTLATNDLGFIDPTGSLVLLGRLDDIIICGGENIYPVEIEDALLQHYAIAEAAVVGVPDDRLGELPVASIVFRRGASATQQELAAYCRTHFSVRKCPRAFYVALSLPKTSAGKLQRSIVRKEIRNSASSFRRLGGSNG